MTNLLRFLNLAIAFIYNLISILFTPVGWTLKLVGIVCTFGGDGILDLLNQIGVTIYAKQINATNTNGQKGQQ